MPLVASQITRVTLDEDRTIASGESIVVYNILIANPTANNIVVTIKDSSEANTHLVMAVPARDSISFEGPWIAGGGLKIMSQSDANIVATITHGAGGA